MAKTREKFVLPVPKENVAVHERLPREQSTADSEIAALEEIHDRAAQEVGVLSEKFGRDMTDQALTKTDKLEITKLENRAKGLFGRLQSRIEGLLGRKKTAEKKIVMTSSPDREIHSSDHLSGSETYQEMEARINKEIPEHLTAEQLTRLSLLVDSERLLVEKKFYETPNYETKNALNNLVQKKIAIMERLEKLNREDPEIKQAAEAKKIDDYLKNSIQAPPESKLNYDMVSDSVLNSDPLLLLGRYFQDLNEQQDSLKYSNDSDKNPKRMVIAERMEEAARALEKLRKGDPVEAEKLVKDKFYYVSGGQQGTGIDRGLVLDSIKRLVYPKLKKDLQDSGRHLLADFQAQAEAARQQLKGFAPETLDVNYNLQPVIKAINERINHFTEVLSVDQANGRQDRAADLTMALQDLEKSRKTALDLMEAQKKLPADLNSKAKKLESYQPIATDSKEVRETLAEVELKKDIAALEQKLEKDMSSLENFLSPVMSAADFDAFLTNPNKFIASILELTPEKIAQKIKEVGEKYKTPKKSAPDKNDEVGRKRLSKAKLEYNFWNVIPETVEIMHSIRQKQEKLKKYESDLVSIQNFSKNDRLSA